MESSSSSATGGVGKPNTSTKPSPTVYFGQYKLAVEMVDRVSARRATANSFFLTLLVGLGAVLGITEPNVLISGVGVVLALTWWALLRSYRDLSAAKFDVILEMESNLPARPFGDEWKTLKKDPVKWWRPRYAELGTVERFVPWVFAVIYIVTAIDAVIS